MSVTPIANTAKQFCNLKQHNEGQVSHIVITSWTAAPAAGSPSDAIIRPVV